MKKRAAALTVGAILARAGTGFAKDDGAPIAAYMAYSVLLAFFPFLIFTFSLLGLYIGEDGLGPTLDFVFDVMPEHVAKTMEPVVREVVRNRSGGVLSFSAVGAIWIASNCVEALRVALDRAYRVKTRRPYWKTRLLSIAFTLGGVLAFGALAVFIVLGPSISAIGSQYFGLGDAILTLWNWLRYIIGGLVMLIFMVLMHKTLPGDRLPIPVWPGILFTIVAWMMLASLFSIYFRYAPSYAVTYGALGGVIATLLFFYVSSAIFIFGAHINAARYRRRVFLSKAERNDAAPVI